jgi:hypothetical protein
VSQGILDTFRKKKICPACATYTHTDEKGENPKAEDVAGKKAPLASRLSFDVADRIREVLVRGIERTE